MNEGQLFEKLTRAYELLSEEIGKVIIGQKEVVTELLTALFAGGHCILVGVPGLAKTLLVSTVARSLDLDFSRIQFTPDLMPSDIMGTEVLEEDRTTGSRVFKFIKGPVFANVVLADEINRTPPKTQAALLQAMQELEVTVGGKTRPLPAPFFVLATRNPIELEGTYPLPEAQLDRFMFDIRVDYPSEGEELEIVEKTTSSELPGTEPVLEGKDILRIREAVRKVPVSRDLLQYAVSLVRMTREKEEGELGKYLSWGAGPRAGQYLVLAAKTRSVMLGRTTPEIMDVRAVAHPVLRHRLVTNFHAEADGVSTDELIDRLMEAASAGKV
ncbi:MAG: AAA domain-containing protein [Candidatus Latescibacteria bacterium]|nr:AAA domain-containing protein [bacterium]MBD3423759.1 AAA domain-containing protein [Candidatus Latescibacterota bacterium]